MAHLNSVFPMMIALFDPGHLPIDLCQDCRSALLGPYNRIVVQSQRHKIARVVGLELDSPDATEMPVSSILIREEITRTVALLV
jgi:hypothetical protein